MAKKPSANGRPFARWSRTFLSELAATSNVTAAARRAGVSTTTVYEARRANAEFNRDWMQALCEGYDLLELDLLRRLREGEVKPLPGAKRSARSYDNATAFRLLAAHRESAARQRAIRSNEDAAAIIVSINEKLGLMRRRLTAADAAAAEDADPE